MLVSHLFIFLHICPGLSRTTYRRKYHLSLHPHASAGSVAVAAAPLAARIPDKHKWLALGAPSWGGGKKKQTVSHISHGEHILRKNLCIYITTIELRVQTGSPWTSAAHLLWIITPHWGVCVSNWIHSNRRHHQPLNLWFSLKNPRSSFYKTKPNLLSHRHGAHAFFSTP